jgi:hypothetical protein
LRRLVANGLNNKGGIVTAVRIDWGLPRYEVSCSRSFVRVMIIRIS